MIVDKELLKRIVKDIADKYFTEAALLVDREYLIENDWQEKMFEEDIYVCPTNPFITFDLINNNLIFENANNGDLRRVKIYNIKDFELNIK